MRPSRRLLGLLMVAFVFALGLALGRWLAVVDASALAVASAIWYRAMGVLALVVLIDALNTGYLRHIVIERNPGHNLSLGLAQPVLLNVKNNGSHPLSLTITETEPDAFEVSGLPLIVEPEAKGQCQLRYALKPLRRGRFVLPGMQVRAHSRWGFWEHCVRRASDAEIKVYPNYTAMRYTSMIDMDNYVRQLGVHYGYKRGEGLEFNQLREFIEGDAIGQVDWKATARYRKPISREYQEERDQDVFFLLDCGRRMRHEEQDGSHFDLSLNALLLNASIAVRQGDAVGLMSFAGRDSRWLSPRKGRIAIQDLLEQLYDLECSGQSSDFVKAAEQFTRRHRKRALVILLTNVGTEDSEDLKRAIGVLAKRHLVLIASLRENLLDECLRKPVENFEQALEYGSAQAYLQERAKALRAIGRQAQVIDSSPHSLHIDLLNTYVAMKRQRRV